MTLGSEVLTGDQKRVVFLRDGVILLKGVAGSGKTTIALHRALHLNGIQLDLLSGSKRCVGIFTFNKTLVSSLECLLNSLSSEEQEGSENITITNFHKWAWGFLFEGQGLAVNVAKGNTGKGMLTRAIVELASKEKLDNPVLDKKDFLLDEISWIKSKLIESLVDYKESKRIGRGTSDRVTQSLRDIIWKVYLGYENQLAQNKYIDFDDFARLALKKINSDPDFSPPFTHLIIDEAQDLKQSELSVLVKLVPSDQQNITIVADLAQRIYKTSFSWLELGLSVRGRSFEFKHNYRNAGAIAKAAGSLLENDPENSMYTTASIERVDGYKPLVRQFLSFEHELEYMLEEIKRIREQDSYSRICVLHRTNKGVTDIARHLTSHGITLSILNAGNGVEVETKTFVCTMSSAKGLEFEYVLILDLNDHVIGHFLEAQEGDLALERRLLYTSMTRAREKLIMTYSGRPSRLLNEIQRTLLDYEEGDSVD